MTCFCGNVAGVRADRLMAVLFLLQQREQVTAPEVARELEISERTARRDLDALAMAGVPVYSVQGRGGGSAQARPGPARAVPGRRRGGSVVVGHGPAALGGEPRRAPNASVPRR